LTGADGREYEVTSTPFKDIDGETKVIEIIRDVTEQRQAEEKLERSRDVLRNLAAHMETVREEQRTNFAREIHDELGQALTALKMDVSWLSGKLSVDDPSLREKMASMRELIDKTIETTKRITTELRPGLLDDLGLAAAVEWQAEQFQKKTDIKCHVSIDFPEINLPGELSTALFRTLQESLTNVARHSKASRVSVGLKGDQSQVELLIADNGKGISKKHLSSPKSFGLIGMRERAHYLGGEVNITGKRGKGTNVVARFPIPQEALKR
jgi:signal transduction histidine kinase